MKQEARQQVTLINLKGNSNNMVRKMHSFRTTKIKKGEFEFRVFEGTIRKTPNKQGSFLDSKVIRKGSFPTRARATKRAKVFVKFFRTIS